MHTYIYLLQNENIYSRWDEREAFFNHHLDIQVGPFMGVARIFSGGGGNTFSKIFKKFLKKISKKRIILAYEILRKFSKILKKFRKKIAKSALF